MNDSVKVQIQCKPRKNILRLDRTSSLDTNCNNYSHLCSREYTTNSNHRRIHHIIGNLITRGSYSFKKVWSKSSKKHIACDGRWSFFDNYENCFDCGSPSFKPHKKFSLYKETLKVEDGLIMEGISDSVELRHSSHKACLLALRKGNMLLRINLDTGQIMERVFVGEPSIRYKKIQWNMVNESFTLSSVLFPKQPVHFMRQAGMEVTEVIQLTTFSLMPLEFICKLSVTRQIFGKDVVDASIFLNLLMVMHSSCHVRMFSMEDILKQCRQHSHKLYDQLEDGTFFGVQPSPLTINIKLEECPPCLFEVRCRNRDVMLTMPPCYYVMWPFGDSRGYCCFSHKTDQMVDGGCFIAEDSSIEERVYLHADDSGRIIHLKNTELRMMKLQEQETPEQDRKLVENFVINFCNKPKSAIPRVSQSGRIIKQAVKQDCGQIQEQSVLSVAYSDDLDLMVVTSVSHDSDISVTQVGFYNNWTGELLRKFTLDEAPEEALEQSVCCHLDTITHVFKTYKNRFECHVYKLQPVLSTGDEGWGKWRSQRRGWSNQPVKSANNTVSQTHGPNR